ncbi:MAG: acylphosphatase, partial [Chromatiales bacterium]
MAEKIRVRGLVQGVGFRPTAWRIARELGLAGDVRNDGEGVLVRLWADRDAVGAFCGRLSAECPPLARIDAIERAPMPDQPAPEDFEIIASDASAVRTGVVPDAATCPACRAELLDPADRRYRYPFINCTHCGPRLSIVRAVPYDRANTSMSVFPMCPACRAEYEDPG